MRRPGMADVWMVLSIMGFFGFSGLGVWLLTKLK
jgi:hypothetical protein